MKRIKYLSFCCLAVFLLTACGENKYEKARSEFNEAVNNNDYETAYKKLGDVRNICGKMDYRRCRDQVIRQEATYLLSQKDEQCAERIVYLFAQYYASDEQEEKDKLMKELYDIAKRLNNEEAMKVLKPEGESEETENAETLERE